MKFIFAWMGLDSIKENLERVLKETDLPVDVTIVTEAENLVVSLKKFGTSTLTFASTPDIAGTRLALIGEDIATLHKSHIEEVKKAFIDIAIKAGGVPLAS